MRLLTALVVLALALVAWLGFAPGRARSSPTESREDQTQTESRVAPVLEESKLSAPAHTASTRRAPGGSAQASPAAEPNAVRRLHGLVVDELDHAVVGAEIELREWGEFPEVVASHTVTSGFDGAFEVVLDTTASPKQELAVRAPFHVGVTRWYGDVFQAHGPSLGGADADLGAIELERCGAVQGRVLDPDGRGLFGLSVRLSSSEYAPCTTSAALDGSLSFPEVRAGRWVVVVDDGDWSLDRKVVFGVELGRVTTLPDLVLSPTVTIRGRVVDEEGAAVPGVPIWATSTREIDLSELAWEGTAKDLPEGSQARAKVPTGDGDRAGTRPQVLHETTRSDGEGRFALRVDPGGTWCLSVPETMEHQAFGGVDGDPRCTFAAGAQDVRIVLQSVPRTTFRVVDAVTREPVEQFALSVSEDDTNVGARSAQPVTRHEHGEVHVRVSSRARVTVIAPGYAPSTQPVTPDAADARLQTIALVRASALSGRVLLNGQPVAGARVQALPATAPWYSRKLAGSDWDQDAARYSFAASDTSTGADGRFLLTDLAADLYALRIQADGAAPAWLRSLSVTTAATTDVGDVELVREAAVRGVVRTSSGESPVGIQLTLEDLRSTKVTAEDGAFEFRGLSAGAHWLIWNRPKEWRELDSNDPRRVDFSVPEGGTLELVVRTDAFAPCTVTARVLRHGVPVADVLVGLASTRSTAWKPLGRTDARGLVTGKAEGGDAVNVCAYGEGKALVGRSQAPLALVAGAVHEVTIALAAGRLELQLPAALEIPDVGRVRLRWTNDPSLQALEAWTDGARAGLRWNSSLVDLGERWAGSYDVLVDVERFDRDPADANPKRGTWTSLREPYAAHVEIQDGQTSRIVVP